jgi:hypothetical protein
MCVDGMQDPPPAFKNPKSILNPNSTNIHLLVEHDLMQISINWFEIMQKVTSACITCISK